MGHGPVFVPVFGTNHHSMSTTTERTPLPLARYVTFTVVLLGIMALVAISLFARPVLLPVSFSLLLAMLLNPVVMAMRRVGLNRVISIGIAVFLSVSIIAGLGYFLVTQAMNFGDDVPRIEKALDKVWRDGERWVQKTFDMRSREVDEVIEDVKQDSKQKGGSFVGRTLSTMAALLSYLFLLPVFTFLILFYKDLLLEFLRRLFPPKDQEVLQDVLVGTRGVVQSYLMGLLVEALIVATLNWIGLLVIGVRYALLLAVMGALLNLIPYIGMIIATLVPMAVALSLQDITAAWWVLALYAFVQFLDNNFIVPLVVASRVELNALVSLLAVMVGGLIWGAPGMFLAIPFAAILKVICDRVPAIRPFGYVMGTVSMEEPPKLFRISKPKQRPE